MNAADPAGAAPSVPTTGTSSTIALETEPLVFFHPLHAGSVRPGGVQPVRATVLLEEEPATWLQLASRR